MLIKEEYPSSRRRIDLILVFDSYAWIEYFAGTSKGSTVKELIATADLIYTPSVVLLEIANKYSREGFDANIVRERLRIIREMSIIDPIRDDVLILLRDAQEILNQNMKRLKIRRKPSMVDYYLLALARNINAKIVTGDEHFRGLDLVVYLDE